MKLVILSMFWYSLLATAYGCTDLEIDIVLVLDSSGSVGSQNFQTMLDFVKVVVQGFEIASTKTRVGVVQYSSSVRSTIHLNEYLNIQSLLNAVSKIVYSGGGTDTAKAIRYVRETSLNSRNGARLNAPKVVVVITDGRSNNKSETKNEASKLRATNATIISVGVGNGVDQTELNDIASDPDDLHVFTVSDFGVLTSIREQLTKQACSVSCGDPGTITNGQVIGNDYSNGKTIRYTCNQHYNLSGNFERTCQDNGVWSGGTPQCIYVNSCSSFPCQNGATCVNGLNSYKCKCDDGWAGKNCDRDIQPPLSSKCPNSTQYVDKRNIVFINWTQPVFHDPFGEELSVSTNYPEHGSMFRWGDYPVSYVALKKSNGLREMCNFNISLRPYQCPELNPPSNGAFVCNGWNSDKGKYCTIFCKEGFKLQSNISIQQEYLCGGSGNWVPSGPLQDCSVSFSTIPENLRKYYYKSCSDAEDVKRIQNAYLEKLRNSGFSSLCSSHQSVCNPSNVDIKCN